MTDIQHPLVTKPLDPETLRGSDVRLKPVISLVRDVHIVR